MLDSGFDADFFNDLTEFSCQDNFCNLVDLIGPPPDMILDLPPPPIPSFLKGLNILNDSENLERCNHCNQFSDEAIGGLGFTLPKQTQNNLFTVNSLAISIGLGVISAFLLVALYIKYKRMKISMADTCSSFSQSFFFKNKDLQVSSRVENCTPVVNEKAQSIITNSPSKKSTIIPAKYWKAPNVNGINFAHSNNHLMINSHEFNDGLIDSTMTSEMGEYMQDEGSCTSSPVYAECLDSNNHQIGLDNMSNLITLNNMNNLNPMNVQARYKSYTMRNYSEMPNTIKINQLNQLNQLNPDAALLPDVSYDNEAYLPSNHCDYHNKSLKRMMKSSKTPLLSTHCPTNVNHSLTLGYLNNDKPKQTFIQHQVGSRINVNNTLMLKNQDQNQINIQQPRYVQSGTNKKNLIIYNGQPIISNSTNFQQKRPLPSLPHQNFI